MQNLTEDEKRLVRDVANLVKQSLNDRAYRFPIGSMAQRMMAQAAVEAKATIDKHYDLVQAKEEPYEEYFAVSKAEQGTLVVFSNYLITLMMDLSNGEPMSGNVTSEGHTIKNSTGEWKLCRGIQEAVKAGASEDVCKLVRYNYWKAKEEKERVGESTPCTEAL